MNLEQALRSILEGLQDPILFADTDHITRFMNRAARSHYPGGEDLIGKSLLDCHNEETQAAMQEILGSMIQENLEEQQISEEVGKRVFMRVVRDADGKVLGYYERFELTPDT